MDTTWARERLSHKELLFTQVMLHPSNTEALREPQLSIHMLLCMVPTTDTSKIGFSRCLKVYKNFGFFFSIFPSVK
jgi:predicted nucleotide-binding protein (sugar kinase/HSP70/actin superfamily)